MGDLKETFESMKQEFELSIEQTRKYVAENKLTKSQSIKAKELTLELINGSINTYSGICSEADDFVKYLESIKKTVVEIF